MEETTDIFSQEDYFEIAIFEQYKRKVIKACEVLYSNVLSKI